MKPPYRPGHVETVVKAQSRELVFARCSCGWRGPFLYPLGQDHTARLLISDFNAHRQTYV